MSRVLFELGEDWGLWLPEGIRKAQILRLDVRLPGRPKKPWPKPLKPMVQQLERVEPEALIDGGDCALVQMESGQLALVQSAAFIAPWTEASFPRWRISARPQLLEGDRDPFSALRVSASLVLAQGESVCVAGQQGGELWQAPFEGWLDRFVRRSVLDATQLAWPEVRPEIVRFLESGRPVDRRPAREAMQEISPALRTALLCAFEEERSAQRAVMAIQAARAAVGLMRADIFEVVVRARLLRYCWAAGSVAGGVDPMDSPYTELRDPDAQVWMDAVMEAGSLQAVDSVFSSVTWLD